MKPISSSHYFLHLLHSTSKWLHCLHMIQVGLLSASAPIYRENLQFDRLKFKIWLVDTDHVKM